jgi:Na+/proline symporter
MTNPLTLLKRLFEEGKVHKKLITRVRMLFIIAVILIGIVLYNIVTRNISAYVAFAVALLGYVLGRTLFSGMSKVVWNEEEEELQAGKMDIVGFASIGLYVLFEIGLRTFLKDAYPDSAMATVYILAGVGGTLFGRTFGMIDAMLAASKDK